MTQYDTMPMIFLSLRVTLWHYYSCNTQKVARVSNNPNPEATLRLNRWWCFHRNRGLGCH